MWAPGKAGTRLPRIAALPRWRRIPSLPQRWEVASDSSCPVCLARAAASFFTSLSAPECQPPKVSATRGKKAMPSVAGKSALWIVAHNLKLVWTGRRDLPISKVKC